MNRLLTKGLMALVVILRLVGVGGILILRLNWRITILELRRAMRALRAESSLLSEEKESAVLKKLGELERMDLSFGRGVNDKAAEALEKMVEIKSLVANEDARQRMLAAVGVEETPKQKTAAKNTRGA